MELEITEKHLGKHIISKAIVKHNDRRDRRDTSSHLSLWNLMSNITNSFVKMRQRQKTRL